MLFPGRDTPPYFQWVQLYTRNNESGIFEDFHSDSVFGTEDKDGLPTYFNSIQGRTLARTEGEGLHWFKKMHDDNASETANIGLRSFTRSGVCWEEFRGPLFVLRTATSVAGQVQHLDMTMRDVRNAADFLTQTYRDCNNYDQVLKVKTLGTVIASAGQTTQGVDKWRDVVLDGCDNIWNSDGACIANLLGLPLLCRTDANPFETQADPKLRNDEIALLYRDLISLYVLDPVEAPKPGPKIYDRADLARSGTSEGSALTRQYKVGVRGYGSSLVKYSIDTTGTAYLVRADGKPFPSQHAEALCSYIKTRVEPQLVQAISGLAPNVPVAQREFILQSITRADFEKYYNDFKAAKIAKKDKTWMDLPSPYEIKKNSMNSRMKEVSAGQKAEGFETPGEKYARQLRGEFVEADFLDIHGGNKDALPEGFLENLVARTTADFKARARGK